ncbi:MAG: TetR/AcrR family transcriptional regulator [Solidesulfovibrio sp. DCME]|uniref:TetR/AcrR family transcriptional regulator n=1 Tax=Solidesulfovibrio sp. DCME TaxID=3447380 RepID=UPI003D0CDF4E
MGRKQTPTQDVAATRSRIIDAAENLFRDVGYAKTTVSDIAKVLGMSPANVYRYFPTKASINESICDRLVRNIESQCFESLIEDGTSTQRLTRFIFKYFRVIKNNIIKEKRLHDMISIAVDEHWSVIRSHSERVRDLLRIIIEQGIDSGEFRTVNSAKAATAVHQAIAFFAYPSLVEHLVKDAENNGNDMEEELTQLLDLILCGLRSNCE